MTPPIDVPAEAAETLATLRTRIETIDEQLVRLLGERVWLARATHGVLTRTNANAGNGRTVRSPRTIAAVMASVASVGSVDLAAAAVVGGLAALSCDCRLPGSTNDTVANTTMGRIALSKSIGTWPVWGAIKGGAKRRALREGRGESARYSALLVAYHLKGSTLPGRA